MGEKVWRMVRNAGLCLCICLVGTSAYGEERLSEVMTVVFQGYGGDTEFIGPMNGAMEQIVATHLRSWVACDADGYIQTVGGFIYERLGGQTSTSAMREGLEVRYPGNPVASVRVSRIDAMGDKRGEAVYEATHRDGTAVSRVLHLELLSQGWRVVRVSKLR